MLILPLAPSLWPLGKNRKTVTLIMRDGLTSTGWDVRDVVRCRSPAKAVSAFVPHSATALQTLAALGPRKYGVRWEAQRHTALAGNRPFRQQF